MVNLGDEVVCTITGFKGVVTSITEFINGCRRCGVQPKVGKDGKHPDAMCIDEPNLKVTKPKVAPRGPRNVGGPSTVIRSEKAPSR